MINFGKNVKDEYPRNLINAIVFEHPLYPSRLYDFDEVISNFDKRLEIVYEKFPLLEIQKNVIELRFKEHLTQSEVGNRLNLSGSRIGQIEKKALIKLSHPKRQEILFLGVKCF